MSTTSVLDSTINTVEPARAGHGTPIQAATGATQIDGSQAERTPVDRPPAVLVVGSDRLCTESLAAAIDPTGIRSIPVTVSEAVHRIEKGGVEVVVLMPRGVEANPLLNAVRVRRNVHLVVAASGAQGMPPIMSGLRPVIATSLDEVHKHVDQFVSLSTDLALTTRHLDILQRIAQGDTPAEAAETLGITVKTLNNHLGVVYRRLGARNVTQAVLSALRAGLVRL